MANKQTDEQKAEAKEAKRAAKEQRRAERVAAKQTPAPQPEPAAALVALPKLPKAARKPKPTRPCVCGCGGATKGAWVPGHDGRATGWAVRIERGLLVLADVPATERPGAELRLAQRAGQAGAVEAAA